MWSETITIWTETDMRTFRCGPPEAAGERTATWRWRVQAFFVNHSLPVACPSTVPGCGGLFADAQTADPLQSRGPRTARICAGSAVPFVLAHTDLCRRWLRFFTCRCYE